MNLFTEPKLIKEYPGIISGKIPVRIYTTKEGKGYRWHIGLQEKFIKPLCPLIECTPYWGQTHWGEEDFYWIWSTWIVTTDETIPAGALQKDLKYKVRCLNNVKDFLLKSLKK